MNFESSGRDPSSDSHADGQGNPQPASERWGPWLENEENAQSPTDNTRPQSQNVPVYNSVNPQFPQFVHREHVSRPLPTDPSEAPQTQLTNPPYPQLQGYSPQGQVYPPYPPNFPYPQQTQYPQGSSYPGYPPNAGYQGNPGYSGYAPGYGYPQYPGYNVYPYPLQPQPKRDTYQLTLGIVSVVGSSLVLLAGIVCALIALLFSSIPHPGLSASDFFSGLVLFIAFASAGVIGGIFALYHSIRSLLQKPSAAFKLPAFWIFVILYLGVVVIGYVLQSQGEAVTYPALTILLIALAGIFPALAILALGVRRLRFPTWPTTWRRFTLSLVSGATFGIALASLLELGLGALLVRGASVNPLQCIDQPNLSGCQDPRINVLILIIVAGIAPVVEEAVKPLAVVALIGRIRSAAEAFVLGLACGVGFDMVETSGYIGTGYHDWLNVALVRSGSSLLHGFGAAMVALGWYYLTHAKRHRLLLAIACWLYAVLQHAIWNGSWGLVLLPDPLGHFFNTWQLNLGFTSLASYEIINIVEALFILAFFIYMTGRLRTKT